MTDFFVVCRLSRFFNRFKSDLGWLRLVSNCGFIPFFGILATSLLVLVRDFTDSLLGISVTGFGYLLLRQDGITCSLLLMFATHKCEVCFGRGYLFIIDSLLFVIASSLEFDCQFNFLCVLARRCEIIRQHKCLRDLIWPRGHTTRFLGSILSSKRTLSNAATVVR